MVEWWQALLISVSSSATVGFVGLATAYFVNHLTRQATIEAEERDARRQVEQEYRQARREERRQAVAGVKEFLSVAARVRGGAFVKETMGEVYDRNLGDIQQAMSRSDFEGQISRILRTEPSPFELLTRIQAAQALAPTSEISWQVFVVWAWVTERGEGSTEKLRRAIQEAYALVDDYIAEGAPSRPAESN